MPRARPVVARTFSSATSFRVHQAAFAVLLSALAVACDLNPVAGGNEAEVVEIAIGNAVSANGRSGPPPSVAGVEPADAAVETGGKLELVALDVNGVSIAASWSSSDESVATVSSDGLVSGLENGTVTIVARTQNRRAQALISVIPAGVSPPAPGEQEIDFASIIRGVRPRGFGVTPYELKAPAVSGRAYYVSPDGDDSGAGTASAPFLTIQRAADVAEAGDVVTIREGIYRESVRVRNAGASDQPIVFQAAARGTVVLTGGVHNFQPEGWTSGRQEDGAVHVTLRGLIFRDYGPAGTDLDHRVRGAVGAIRGWTIEDCLFDSAGYTGLDIRGSDVMIVRSTFQFHHTNAINAYAPKGSQLTGIRVQDVVIRGNNTRSDPLSGTVSESVAKFLRTSGTVIENIESFDNHGSGFWFDTDNSDFVIRDSYLHHNSKRGLFVEINWPGGMVERNVVSENSGPGITIANSRGVTVRDNLILGNEHCFYLVYVDRGTDASGSQLYPLADVSAQRNRCASWSGASAVHAVGELLKTPGDLNVVTDGTTFDPGNVGALAWWPEIGWSHTITDLRQKPGWEQNGRIAPVGWPG